MAKINVGDKVVNRYGRIGTVTEVLCNDKGEHYYKMLFEGSDNASNYFYRESDIALVPELKKTYRYELTEEDGVVVAVLYEECGGLTREIARSHAHVIHDDPLRGYTQAASYALKKIYFSLFEEEINNDKHSKSGRKDR